MEIKAKNITLVDISLLVENPKNNNSHPEDQIERLAKLIKHTGFRNPLVVSNRSGFVLCGHGRIAAAKRAGLKELPVIYQDFRDEAEEYAYMTADNAIHNWSSIDLSKVNTEMLDLGPDFDIDMLGIKDFVIEPIEKFEPQSDEDDVPEVVHPITRKGDLWLLGKHRLLCGDSTMIDDVERLMGGEKADMVFTDPPYGVSYQSNMRKKSERFEVIKNDEQFISEWVNILPVVSSGWVFVWTSWKVIRQWIDICEPIGSMTNMVVWDKGGGGIGDLQGSLSTDFELALVYNRGAKLTGKRIGSVWSVGKDKARDYAHPTQKPVELASMALASCATPSSVVMDLFAGSGSTMIACEKSGQSFRGMELDEKYCDVIIKRFEQYTGKKAILESTGQTYEELKAERDNG